MQIVTFSVWRRKMSNVLKAVKIIFFYFTKCHCQLWNAGYKFKLNNLIFCRFWRMIMNFPTKTCKMAKVSVYVTSFLHLPHNRLLRIIGNWNCPIVWKYTYSKIRIFNSWKHSFHINIGEKFDTLHSIFRTNIHCLGGVIEIKTFAISPSWHFWNLVFSCIIPEISGIFIFWNYLFFSEICDIFRKNWTRPNK